MIERYLIHYFLAVVDQGNFSRAAQQCGVSQPTLSVGIAKLETLVGHLLFQRSNRRVELTGAGVKFADHARQIEAQFARAEAALRSDKGRQLIRIGIITSLPASWIGRAVRETTVVEDEQLEIVEGRMRDLLPRLERGRIDALVGVTGHDPRARDIMFEEGYGLALPATHPLADRPVVDAGEVADAPMIVRRHCEALTDISRHFTQRGVRPFFSARTTNDERCIALVQAGLGITVMPHCFRQPGIAMPALHGFDQRRAIGFLVDPSARARIERSRIYERFRDTLRQIARS